MNDVLEHRGPDQCGIYSDDTAALSLTRLAILDPTKKGKQPMEHDDLVISYNGEVYNFQSLRASLRDDGYQFISNTDTEVILKGYHHEGADFFEKINGIVAFAIYDKNEKELILFRDRLGIKPLYYCNSGSKLIVSSEIKSIVAAFGDEIQLTQDGVAIHEYLGTRNVRAESFFDEVNAVRPGCLLKYDIQANVIESHRLVDIYDEISPERYRANKQDRSEEELIDELDQLLNEVIERQLVSDVPIATICSGGVDSSLVTAIASQYRPNITVYHVRVDERGMDESKHAKLVASYFDLDMKMKTLDREEYVARFEDCIYHNDLPLTHPNSVGVAAVNELAADDGIKVLMTGEGADEVFGGYTRYLLQYLLFVANDINIAKRVWSHFTKTKYLSFAFLENRDSILEFFLRDSTSTDTIDKSLTGKRRQLLNELKERYEFIESDRKLDSTAYIASELRHYLIPLLRRADRMSMRSSVEARVPFLDNDILDFGLNLPHRYKLNRLETKYLLKKVAERYLPDEIVYRTKRGFPVPVEQWLSEEGHATDAGYNTAFYEIWKDQI
jgi:asparagine synthase (glutamine-hydrolysing)